MGRAIRSQSSVRVAQPRQPGLRNSGTQPLPCKRVTAKWTAAGTDPGEERRAQFGAERSQAAAWN